MNRSLLLFLFENVELKTSVRNLRWKSSLVVDELAPFVNPVFGHHVEHYSTVLQFLRRGATPLLGLNYLFHTRTLFVSPLRFCLSSPLRRVLCRLVVTDFEIYVCFLAFIIFSLF